MIEGASRAPEGLRVEPATEADVAVILRLIAALAAYEHMSDDVVADEPALRASLFGPSPAAEVILARLDGEPAGFAVWFHNYSTFLGRRGLYLEDLFVVPEWRGRGIGRALLAYLARVAVARDCGRMEWAVLDWNEPAIGFYQRLGAKPMGDWTVYRLTGDELKRLAADRSPNDPQRRTR
jgi:GNAT superfamily N-acetyltransferase